MYKKGQKVICVSLINIFHASILTHGNTYTIKDYFKHYSGEMCVTLEETGEVIWLPSRFELIDNSYGKLVLDNISEQLEIEEKLVEYLLSTPKI